MMHLVKEGQTRRRCIGMSDRSGEVGGQTERDETLDRRCLGKFTALKGRDNVGGAGWRGRNLA